MSGVSLPVSRPSGRALLIGNPASRDEPLSQLGSLGYVCDAADDPYSAFAEICLHPDAYQAVVVSLSSLYREELDLIASIKHRVPRMEVWLAQTDGRQSFITQALRLGADGLLAEDGFYRIAAPPDAPSPPSPAADEQPQSTPPTAPASIAPHRAIDPLAAPLAGAPSNELTPAPGRDPGPTPATDLAEPHENNRASWSRASDGGSRGEDDDFIYGEPLLSAEELRALLEEHPTEARS